MGGGFKVMDGETREDSGGRTRREELLARKTQQVSGTREKALV